MKNKVENWSVRETEILFDGDFRRLYSVAEYRGPGGNGEAKVLEVFKERRDAELKAKELRGLEEVRRAAEEAKYGL